MRFSFRIYPENFVRSGPQNKVIYFLVKSGIFYRFVIHHKPYGNKAGNFQDEIYRDLPGQ